MMWAGLRKQLDSAELKKLALVSHFKGMIVLFMPYLAMLLFAHVDRILIGLITSDMAQVGFYDMAFRFVAIALGISTALSSALVRALA